MIKNSIKKIVVLPLFIATLFTSFYVMQPQNAFAAHTEIYKDSGDDSDTPLATDRFDAIEEGDVDTIATQDSTAIGTTNSKVELELQQFIDCVRGPTPSGTCESIFMEGDQDVHLRDTSTGYVDVEADLFMLQKDDTDGQNNVDNTIRGKQEVTVDATGSATVDISHNSNNNELNFDMYQYNKRGPIPESTTDFEIDDVQAAVASESGGGNDDTTNVNRGTQTLDADASGSSVIRAATSGDMDFRLAQFNAGCDDTDNEPRDITCENNALHNIDLDSTQASRLTFNTLSPIEHQQINTCTFSDILRCLNGGEPLPGEQFENAKIDVDILTQGSAQANVQLENPNGQPVLFQENTCSNLANSPSQQQCTNRSNNFFDVQSGTTSTTDNSNIQKTNLDLQVAQANDCDNASAPIDCVNRGLTSDIIDLNNRNIQTEFGAANTIVTVQATDDATIEDADPDSFLTMVNDCDGANPEGSTLGSSNCVNEALNEAHFVASAGGYVDVDRVVQESTTTNSCDGLDDDTCKNTAQNTFVANAANDATININADVTQTTNGLNDCDQAECTTDMLNEIFLAADRGADIETISSSGIDQSITATNGCTTEATCAIIGANFVNLFADGGTDFSGGDIDIQKLTQDITYTNTCSSSGTVCNIQGTNFYNVVNTSPSTITVDSDQTLSRTNSFSDGATHNTLQNNIVNIQKSSGTSLYVDSSQLINTGGTTTNQITSSPSASGTCSVTQTNGQNSPRVC